MNLRLILSSIRKSRCGSVAVEFALIGPLFITLLFGVLQIGIAMQNYNALRGVSADVARYAMIQYSTGNRLSTSQMRSYALSVGRNAPYLLKGARLNATVSNAATQRVSGATELTLTVTYQIPSLLSSMGLEGPYITYNRPIFVTNP